MIACNGCPDSPTFGASDDACCLGPSSCCGGGTYEETPPLHSSATQPRLERVIFSGLNRRRRHCSAKPERPESGPGRVGSSRLMCRPLFSDLSSWRRLLRCPASSPSASGHRLCRCTCARMPRRSRSPCRPDRRHTTQPHPPHSPHQWPPSRWNGLPTHRHHPRSSQFLPCAPKYFADASKLQVGHWNKHPHPA